MNLSNHRLSVTIADPSKLQTQRFDHTALIRQVLLDGKYTFCTPEQVLPHRRTTFGFGLAGEFLLEGAAEETRKGQWFLKPGVGLMEQRADFAPYDMWQHYNVKPFPVSVAQEGDSLVFTQESGEAGGYGIRIQKQLSLRENRLIMDIQADNTGKKPCILREYQHNFLSLEGKPIGPGYALEIPCDRTLGDIIRKTLRQGDEIVLPSAVRVEDSRILWTDDLNGKVMYHRSDDIAPDAPHRWTLRHTQSPCTVSEAVDFIPSRMDIWAVEHCACTEFYFSAGLLPGESARWQRVWTFGP